jgi:hypothetical protein
MVINTTRTGCGYKSIHALPSSILVKILLNKNEAEALSFLPKNFSRTRCSLAFFLRSPCIPGTYKTAQHWRACKEQVTSPQGVKFGPAEPTP